MQMLACKYLHAKDVMFRLPKLHIISFLDKYRSLCCDKNINKLSKIMCIKTKA